MTAAGAIAGPGFPVQNRRSGAWSVFRIERRKLSSQLAVRVLALICLLGPFVFAGILKVQSGSPTDTLFGIWVHSSGFTVSLVLLAFAGSWGFPIIAGIVAGDMFSAEDTHGTFKTILTRSTSRSAIFWGKTLAAFVATSALVLLLGTSSLLAGLTTVGAQSFVDVGSAALSPGQGLEMVVASWLSVLPPIIGFAAIALCVSIVTRSSVLGVVIPVVVGLVFQMYTFLNAWDTVRHSLLNTPMNAWRGLFDNPSYSAPFWDGLAVSAVYTALFLAVGYFMFRNRNVTEG